MPGECWIGFATACRPADGRGNGPSNSRTPVGLRNDACDPVAARSNLLVLAERNIRHLVERVHLDPWRDGSDPALRKSCRSILDAVVRPAGRVACSFSPGADIPDRQRSGTSILPILLGLFNLFIVRVKATARPTVGSRMGGAFSRSRLKKVRHLAEASIFWTCPLCAKSGHSSQVSF